MSQNWRLMQRRKISLKKRDARAPKQKRKKPINQMQLSLVYLPSEFCLQQIIPANGHEKPKYFQQQLAHPHRAGYAEVLYSPSNKLTRRCLEEPLSSSRTYWVPPFADFENKARISISTFTFLVPSFEKALQRAGIRLESIVNKTLRRHGRKRKFSNLRCWIEDKALAAINSYNFEQRKIEWGHLGVNTLKIKPEKIKIEPPCIDAIFSFKEQKDHLYFNKKILPLMERISYGPFASREITRFPEGHLPHTLYR